MNRIPPTLRELKRYATSRGLGDLTLGPAVAPPAVSAVQAQDLVQAAAQTAASYAPTPQQIASNLIAAGDTQRQAYAAAGLAFACNWPPPASFSDYGDAGQTLFDQWYDMYSAGIPTKGTTPATVTTPDEYLTAALINQDWDRVFTWYSYNINLIWAKNQGSNAFWTLSQVNLADYKYTLDANGNKQYLPFTLQDLYAFVSKVVVKCGVWGNMAQTSFGFNDPGAASVDPCTVPYSAIAAGNPNAADLVNINRIKALLVWLQTCVTSAMNNSWSSVYEGVVDSQNAPASPTPYQALCVGWIAPPKASVWDEILQYLPYVIAAVAAIYGGFELVAYFSTAGSVAAGSTAADLSDFASSYAAEGTDALSQSLTTSIAADTSIDVSGDLAAAADAPLLSAADSAALDAATGAINSTLATASGATDVGTDLGTELADAAATGPMEEVTVTASTAANASAIATGLTDADIAGIVAGTGAAAAGALDLSSVSGPNSTDQSNINNAASGASAADSLPSASTLSKILGAVGSAIKALTGAGSTTATNADGSNADASNASDYVDASGGTEANPLLWLALIGGGIILLSASGKKRRRQTS